MAGIWDVTVTETATGTTGSDLLTVTPAPAVSLQILAPASVVSGQSFDITVIAVDPCGNIDVNYQGTVHFTSSDSDPGVVLPADYPFQLSDAGMVTFPGGATLITAGNQTITATDTVSGIMGSATVTVGSPGGGGSGVGSGRKPRCALARLSATLAVDMYPQAPQPVAWFSGPAQIHRRDRETRAWLFASLAQAEATGRPGMGPGDGRIGNEAWAAETDRSSPGDFGDSLLSAALLQELAIAGIGRVRA
jgi:hypothetical protein